jgi:geranylgeranyl transferase type-2 subunit beta
MQPASYLERLTNQLRDGLARLPAELRARQVAYLLRGQNPDGGWSGREGDSDLYYTGFALRGLALLDALEPEVCDRAAGYLRRAATQQASVVDFYSFLYACLLVQTSGGPDVLADSPPDWPDRVAATLEKFRAPDGGYTKTLRVPQPGDTRPPAGSTYHTFLVGLCYELLGRSLPDPAAAHAFVLSRRREDGGFVEVAAQRKSGTNPTAAAIGVQQLLGDAFPLSAEVREGVVDFLADRAGPDGGLCANTQAPLSDLLSTFTGAWTLHQLGALDRLDHRQLRGFAEALDRHEEKEAKEAAVSESKELYLAQALDRKGGGFRGGLWDDGHDVEYTFYGLGVLALLS